MIRSLHRLVLSLPLALTGAVAGVPSTPAEPLRVVATIPDLADIAKQIGGERVSVESIARGKENTHAVPIRPSHMVAMNKADMFVQIGLSLEVAFVPGLLEGSRNPRIQPGQPGFVNCSEGWEALEVPASVSRQGGDVHPQGNPHLNLDPRAGRHIAGRVLEALVRVDPAGKDAYERRHAQYAAALDAAEQRWAAQAAAWKGAKFVEYHQEFKYFAQAYGLEVAASLEPKPGIPPTPNHTAEVIETMKREHVAVIVTAVWSNNDVVERVAEATGAAIVEVPNMCGGLPGTDTWIGMMDVMHARLGQAFAAGRAEAGAGRR